MSKLLELAERCKRATGPDSELGLAISEACEMETPHFCPTASLDAAMTLVPEGCVWSVGDWSAIDKWVGATCWPPEDRRPVDFSGITLAATPALALTAAALRALAAQEDQSQAVGA